MHGTVDPSKHRWMYYGNRTLHVRRDQVFQVASRLPRRLAVSFRVGVDWKTGACTPRHTVRCHQSGIGSGPNLHTPAACRLEI